MLSENQIEKHFHSGLINEECQMVFKNQILSPFSQKSDKNFRKNQNTFDFLNVVHEHSPPTFANNLNLLRFFYYLCIYENIKKCSLWTSLSEMSFTLAPAISNYEKKTHKNNREIASIKLQLN